MEGRGFKSHLGLGLFSEFSLHLIITITITIIKINFIRVCIKLTSDVYQTDCIKLTYTVACVTVASPLIFFFQGEAAVTQAKMTLI